MTKVFVGFLLAAVISSCYSISNSDPIISSWKRYAGVKYNGKATNINGIYYTGSTVYITAEGLPDYSIGPWTANPNSAGGQSWVFSFTSTPSQQTGSKTYTELGQIGAWSNGLVIYNAYDGFSYNSMGIWRRNAYVWEGVSFDSCLGHPDAQSIYHNHVMPICMFNYTDSTKHSPIIGYAFDGFPIYGPYGYTNATDPTSKIKLMTSSYQLRALTKRDKLANGTSLTSAQYGPDVNTTYPLGSYLEDYEYKSASGDLDDCNGRFSITPEYPNGIYAYFITVDSKYVPQYPFVIGPTYYGKVTMPNGRLSLPSSVTTVFKSSSTTIKIQTWFCLLLLFVSIISSKKMF